MKKFQDWSKKTVNFATGCENDCLYCYGKEWRSFLIRLKKGSKVNTNKQKSGQGLVSLPAQRRRKMMIGRECVCAGEMDFVGKYWFCKECGVYESLNWLEKLGLEKLVDDNKQVDTIHE